MHTEDTTGPDLYPMRVVARVTGLPPDTIRAWERRYGAIEPNRTDGNARRYSAADVRKLNLLRDLTDRGHAIGAIATLDADTLETMLERERMRTPSRGGGDDPIAAAREDYLALVTRLDAARASAVLARAAAVLDNRALVLDFVLPIVRAVGERWGHGQLRVGQEHLVSAELRALLAARAHAQATTPGAPRIVVGTPAGHHHEFGVLAAAMLASGRGIDVVYLGTDVPDDDLEWGVRAARASVIVLGVAMVVGPEARDALRATLRRLSTHAEVWLGCPPQLELGELPPRVRLMHSIEAFDVAAAALRA